ncbi:hypothetical protein ACIPSE_08920 [Streptomyces sp. NPDC090106]|uniref:hypothetical protein n=1 Tax=Streptomyces sp. NPDC090106 TaxID=3365946 RepID=UPI003805F19F
MGSKTVDETGAETGTEATTDETAVDVTKADEVTAAEETATAVNEDAEASEDADDFEDDELDAAAAVEDESPTGAGQGAGAIVSAALGLISLSGSWVGTVGSAREALIGQLQTSSSSDVATLVKEGYGDAWNATALWGGVFALVALLVGVVVLARPAFGTPGRPQPVWIKSVAWAGVTLGVIGLLLAVLKYTDILLGLPSTS